MKKIILAASVGVLAIVAGFLLYLYRNPEYQYCTARDEKDGLCQCSIDSDCVKVRGDCCGCSEGGSATVINKTYTEWWTEKNPKMDCLCLTIVSHTADCNATVKCVQGQCALNLKEGRYATPKMFRAPNRYVAFYNSVIWKVKEAKRDFIDYILLEL